MKNVVSTIVTYNFGEDFYENIKLIALQSKVIWIDNSTDFDIDKKIEQILEENSQIVFIKNKENNGLSKSYNIALAMAKKMNADYFVTFDQDTRIEKNTINQLIDLMEKFDFDSIGPNFRKLKRKKYSVSSCNFLISSCNITKMNVYNDINYDERFFIDYVDLDFCLAMKNKGFNYGIANNIKIQHTIGEKYRGKFGLRFNAHKPYRYYYIFRNYYLLKKKYRDFYLVKVKIRLCATKQFIKLFFCSEKKEALFYINKGISEGKKL